MKAPAKSDGWEGLPRISFDPAARYAAPDWEKLALLADGRKPRRKKERRQK
ncbi:MAG: hypothetical protein ABSE16_06020 [Verrucomicrobiota bacterium]